MRRASGISGAFRNRSSTKLLVGVFRGVAVKYSAIMSSPPCSVPVIWWLTKIAASHSQPIQTEAACELEAWIAESKQNLIAGRKAGIAMR